MKQKQTSGFVYPIIYSSNIKIGNIKYARILLDLWKDFDDNTLDKGTHVFADEVRMDFADGTNFTGKRDAFMDVMKSQRKTFKSFKSSIDVVVALKPKGKDENWACVWGSQTSVTLKKVQSTVLINENWMFDKKGKVSYIRQFSAVPQKASTKKKAK
jgi:hypothetical protein